MTSLTTTIDHGPIRELRLSHPPANALSPEMIAALGEAVEKAPAGYRFRSNYYEPMAEKLKNVM